MGAKRRSNKGAKSTVIGIYRCLSPFQVVHISFVSLRESSYLSESICCSDPLISLLCVTAVCPSPDPRHAPCLVGPTPSQASTRHASDSALPCAAATLKACSSNQHFDISSTENHYIPIYGTCREPIWVTSNT